MNNSTDTGARTGERGAVRIKTLLIFTLLAVATFALIKIAPVYVEERQMTHEVDEMARVAAIRSYKEEKINKDIEKLRRDYDMPESAVNLDLRENGVRIIVNYNRTIDFLVTTYTWHIDHTAVGKEL